MILLKRCQETFRYVLDGETGEVNAEVTKLYQHFIRPATAFATPERRHRPYTFEASALPTGAVEVVISFDEGVTSHDGVPMLWAHERDYSVAVREHFE